MAAIFLSYAREDGPVAARLAGFLEDAGHSVWWDRRIDGGEEFSSEIEAELERSDVVLVAWSAHSVKSRWVRDEAAVGGDKGRLVPVTVDGTPAPMGFRQFQTLDLTGWKGGKRDDRSAVLIQSIARRAKAASAGMPASTGEPAKSRPLPDRRARVWAIAAAVVLLFAAGLALWVTNRPTNGPLAKPTIALLPFGATSSDGALRDIAAQSRDSVARMLSQSGIPVRLLDSAPKDRTSAGDFVLGGDLSRNAGNVIATIRLDEATHGVTVFSKSFEAAARDSAELPDRLGAQLAGVLSDGWTLMILDRRHPVEPSIMAELLGMGDDPLQAYQAAKRVAARAPNVAATQIAVAFQTGLALGQLPRADRAEAVAEGRRAFDRGLALAPEFGNTYASWCWLHSDALFRDCELQLLKGNKVDPDATYVNAFLDNVLAAVGRVEERAQIARLSYSHDPYHELKVGYMLRVLEAGGDDDGARQLYQRAVRFWPGEKPFFFTNRFVGLLEHGAFDKIDSLQDEVGADAMPPDYRNSGALSISWQSPIQVRQACSDAKQFHLMIRCMFVLASFGDQDGTYKIANKLYPRRLGRTPAETERIWLDEPDVAAPADFITSPGAAAMRRDPRYLQLAQRAGLLDYWRTAQMPDFCTKQHEPICRLLQSRS